MQGRALLCPLALCLMAACAPDVRVEIHELGALSVGLDRVDLGTHEAGATVQHTLLVANRGDLPLEVGPFEVWDEVGLDAAGAEVDCAAEADGVHTLEPGCELPVVIDWIVDQPVDTSLIVPSSDERLSRTQVRLVGDVEPLGELHVHPRSVLLPRVWPGDTEAVHVDLDNLGEGPVELPGTSLGEGCEAFAFGLLPSGELAPGDTALLELLVTPQDLDGEVCTVRVGDEEVRVQVNLEPCSVDRAPSVEILSPASGAVHLETTPVTLELRIADADQPVEGLGCRIRSANEGLTLTTCSSDHLVSVEVPLEALGPGPDALIAQVTDVCGNTDRHAVAMSLMALPDSEDDDGDGFGVADCDDTTVEVFPSADELADGLDNDCDGAIDEGTAAVDDDGDGFSEEAGDCDDTDPDTFPGAPEQANGRDEDCDGTVDEETPRFDDDGDGWAELELDCDDADPERFPGATEACNGIDDDCDGLVDEACVGEATTRIVGDLRLSATAIEGGESVTISAWLDGPGELVFTTPPVGSALTTTEAATWTAPEVDRPEVFSLAVEVFQDGERSDFRTGEIAVWPPDTLAVAETELVEQPTGCGTAPGRAGMVLVLAALALVVRSRGCSSSSSAATPPRPS